MTDKFFDEMDKSLMKDTESLRQKKVPPQILQGFAHSVETRILQKEETPAFMTHRQKSWVPVWAPVFVVLILASLMVFKMPLAPSPGSMDLSKISASEMIEEISELKDSGVWTQDDEKVLGSSLDDEAEAVLA